jgi:hypothetical protein
VFVEDISGLEEPDEFGMHGDRHLGCFAALLWLGEEGFVRFEETIKQDAIDQATLTSRCFTLLSRPLEVLDPSSDLPGSVQIERSSMIFRLRTALRARSSPELRATMLTLMTQMLGLPDS